MFIDTVFTKKITMAISKYSGETRVDELLGWEKRSGGILLPEIEILKSVYVSLGFLDEKGIFSEYMFFIAGEKFGKRYIASVKELTAKEKEIIIDALKVKIVKITDNLQVLK